MGKLIMWNLITLDGYFEGEKKWDIDFHDAAWGPELERISNETMRAAGHLIFGRVTYEGMAEYWKTAKGETAEYMNKLPKIVCSKTLASADWNNTRVIKDNIAGEIAALKANSDKDIYVLGSANLSETLFAENLFDELKLCIAPVIAGKGTPLFAKGIPERKLRLVESLPLSTGGVVLSYQL